MSGWRAHEAGSVARLLSDHEAREQGSGRQVMLRVYGGLMPRQRTWFPAVQDLDMCGGDVGDA